MSIWSGINSRLEEAKSQLNEMKRKTKFRKANKNRKEAADLQYSLGVCRGKMETCKKDFNRTIQQQSRAIAAGQREGMDTLINEQNLWDAALGYMMVKDAIFALETVTEYDSITHAYEMLDAATRQISGQGIKRLKLTESRTGRKRNDYGYLTAESALKEKEELLDGFFEELKVTGDIEACLRNRRRPEKVTADRRNKYTDKAAVNVERPQTTNSGLDDILAQVSGVPDDDTPLDDYGDDLDAMMDIHPPEDGD